MKSTLAALLSLLFGCWFIIYPPARAAERPAKKAPAKAAAGKRAPDTSRPEQPNRAGPLPAYLGKADPSYKWVKRRTGKIGETEFAELILTSQTWRDIKWRHQLFILKPSTAKADGKHALLYIGGGVWRDRLAQPAADNERLDPQARGFALMAETLGTPVAILLQTPHQPIFGGKYEDQIIAYTLEKFLRTGDVEWPLLLPMVKGAVRAMDATTEFCRQHWKLEAKTFTVTGASKRGWTTWLTAAHDRRVTALAPIVIDVLNVSAHFKHHKAVWGEFSPQLRDYTERGLHNHLSTAAGQKLREIIDPYSYLQHLRQPKLIVIAANDAYWPIDSLNLYWKSLVGPKHILYIPNNGHGVRDYGRLVGSLNALHRQARGGEKLPQLDWKYTWRGDALALRVTADRKSSSARVWVATAPRRDFRKATWRSTKMTRGEDGYSAAIPRPKEGWLAVFGEVVFTDAKLPYYLSTNVRVVGAEEGLAAPAP